MKTTLTVFCFLLSLMETNSIFWRRRRRRRSPPPCGAVNCQVGSWTSWGACTHLCGTSGTQQRTRAVTQTASCGGSCPYSLRQTQACNRDRCQYGGTPHSGGCSCRLGYGGTCCGQGKPMPSSNLVSELASSKIIIGFVTRLLIPTEIAQNGFSCFSEGTIFHRDAETPIGTKYHSLSLFPISLPLTFRCHLPLCHG